MASKQDGAAGAEDAGAPRRPDPELMARRYGRRPGTSRRGTLIAAGLAVVFAIAFAIWWATGLSNNVTTEHVAVEVVDAARIDVTISVIAHPGTTVRCTLRAVNSTFTEVGVREATIGPVRERVTTVTVPITTVERASSGEVLGCHSIQD